MWLGELRLFDLLCHPGDSKALRHGVYLFFDTDGTCVYAGMCSSSHFAHRIGGHFGMSPKYGMNTFLKRAVKELALSEDRNDYGQYVKALEPLANYSLLIIDANGQGKKFIRSLERLVHTVLRPRLNFQKRFPKTYKALAADKTFADAISECGGA